MVSSSYIFVSGRKFFITSSRNGIRTHEISKIVEVKVDSLQSNDSFAPQSLESEYPVCTPVWIWGKRSV